MTAPRSLLEYAGSGLSPADWQTATLLLVDHQREYLDGGLPLPDAGSAIAAMSRLLAAARAHGTPVVHVVHHGRAGGALFDPDGPYAAIVPALTPAAGETVVCKSLPNAFADTGLDSALHGHGRGELIVAGFATHMCISATVRAALDHGYRSTIVADACATRDLPSPLDGGIVTAATLHRASLAALADRFACVVREADLTP